MIHRQSEQRMEVKENMRGGNGSVTVQHMLEKEDSAGAGRLFASVTIPPGASIGLHTHEGDFEIYYLLQGTAHVTDNGAPGILQPGDSMLCRNGDNHSIENRGEEDVRMVALVLFEK